MAERALHGVGDARLGEWREAGRNGVMHIRRRLTDAERVRAGGRRGALQVRDIRGSDEERRRLRRLFQDQPHLREAAAAYASTAPAPTPMEEHL